jgi:hypothetical protein
MGGVPRGRFDVASADSNNMYQYQSTFPSRYNHIQPTLTNTVNKTMRNPKFENVQVYISIQFPIHRPQAVGISCHPCVRLHRQIVPFTDDEIQGVLRSMFTAKWTTKGRRFCWWRLEHNNQSLVRIYHHIIKYYK